MNMVNEAFRDRFADCESLRANAYRHHALCRPLVQLLLLPCVCRLGKRADHAVACRKVTACHRASTRCDTHVCSIGHGTTVCMCRSVKFSPEDGPVLTLIS